MLPVALLVGALVAGQVISIAGTGDAIPPEVVAKAIVQGVANSLLVIGLVLIYRAARIINFAHTAFGFFVVMLYLLLRSAWGWGFWLSLAAAAAAAVLLGFLVELVVVRRFSRAPRLVLTVVTIALGQFIVGQGILLLNVFGFKDGDQLPAGPPSLPFPGLGFSWGVNRFSVADYFTVVVGLGLLLSLALFFRFSTTGIAIRGAAENHSRAALLGVNVNSLSAVVWAIAAVLAGAGFLMTAFLNQSSLVSTAGAGAAAAFSGGVFVRALGAAVIARMESLPVAFAASISIGVIDQAVFWGYRRTAAVDGALFSLIVVALLLQRKSLTRTDPGAEGTWEAAEELQPIPAALNGLEVVRRAKTRFLIAALVIVAGYPYVMSPSQTLQGSLFAIYGIIAVSLVVLTGWGGQISLGQFGFVAVGALVGGWATAGAGLPFPLAVVLAMLAGAAAAVLVGLPALRIQGLFLAVTSLAFAVIAQSILLDPRWFGFLVQSRVTRPVFFGIDMNTSSGERAFYYLCVIALVFAIFVAVSLRSTRTGRVLIALRDNERAAQSFGINLLRTRLVTFAIAGSLAGLAGVMFANHQFSVAQESFGPDQSIFLFLMAVMGGLGSVFGVLLGVIYFGVTRIVLANSGGQLLASSFGVLVVLVAFPGGLGGLAYRARDAWLRRIAQRYRLFVPSLQGVDRREEHGSLVPIRGRADDREPVPEWYVLDSEIGSAGQSQEQRVVL